jgi:hypothetical protein
MDNEEEIDAASPQQRIQEAREKLAAGEFKRTLVKRIPVDLSFDKYELSCGHVIGMLAGLGKDKAEFDCKECANNWMANHDAG